MVQRCVDELAGPRHGRDRSGRHGEPPRHEPRDPAGHRDAVEIGLTAAPQLDLGRFNGERFAVMAGAGFDAAMIRDANRGLKDRSAASRTSGAGSKNIRAKRSRPRSRSTASTGTRARRPPSCSATSGRLRRRRGLRGGQPRRRWLESAWCPPRERPVGADDGPRGRGLGAEVAVRAGGAGAADQGQARPEGRTSSTAAPGRS